MREIAGEIPENGADLVAAIVRKVLGLEVSAIEQIVGRGFNNAVTAASTSRGRFVVRTNVESHLFRFRREAWCLRRLGEMGVLVPEVHGCGIEEGHSYSVAGYIEGSSPVHSGMDQLRVWKTLGKCAVSLNAISESSVNEDPEASGYFEVRWEEQVATDVDLIFKENFWVRNGIVTPAQQGRLREYLQQSAHLSAPRGVCQFDLTCGNALVCGLDYDRIYLLDLEWTNLAPVPVYQLACIAAEHGPESAVTAAFFDGYGLPYKKAVEDFPDLNRLVLLRAMRATAWARDRAPRLIEENLRRTRPIIERVLGCETEPLLR